MIIQQLLEKFPDMPNLRVRDIKVDKIAKKVTCIVSYPTMSQLQKNVTTAIREIVGANIPKGYRYETQLVNDVFNVDSFRNAVCDVLKRDYPLFAHTKDKLEISAKENGFDVVFHVDPVTKKNMDAGKFLENISQYFAAFTCYSTDFAVKVDEKAATEKDFDSQERLVQLAVSKELMKPQRYFNVTDVVKHIGKPITTRPMYISDVRTPMDICVVCGRISGKELKDVTNNNSLKICKFNLTDDSGTTLPCLMFVKLEIDDLATLKQMHDKPESELLTISKKKRLANEKRLKMLMFLSDGLEVLVRGRVVYSNFSHRLEMQMYDISKCRIQPIDMQPKFERAAPDKYVAVQPERIEEFRQLNFDAILGGNKKHGTDCTLLYVNVTGYNVFKDKIFAVAAVKIRDGHPVEKWFTRVAPEVALTDQQLDAVGVSAKQLSLCPTITEVVGDLFKFVGTDTLVGPDVPQVLALLNYYGAPVGFGFKNKTAAQSDVLTQLFNRSTLEGHPNCARTEEICKTCRVAYRPTDFCLTNAMAVASCLSVLTERQR